MSDTAPCECEGGCYRESLVAHEHCERAMRFGQHVARIEEMAERIRLGTVEDVLFALEMMRQWLFEATEIAAEVSREALDKVAPRADGDWRVAPDNKRAIRLVKPLPADSEIKDVLPE